MFLNFKKNKKVIKNFQERIELLEAELKAKDELIKQKETARRKLAGKIGGLTAENNKLLDTIIKLEQKVIDTKREFAAFKEGKYIVKELKPQRVPRKRQVMNIRSGEKTSKIIAKVKPNEDEK